MRCRLISVIASIAAAACFATSPNICLAADHPPLPALIAGADMSVLPVMEAQGAVYKVDGKPVDAMQALADHGFNCVRLRLWVNPTHDDVMVNDLACTIGLARRAKLAHMLVLLDIHYSDTWADAGKQFKPSAWNNLSFDQLSDQVRSYTANVISTMRKEGVMPDIVQVGNEITGGMLWPDGKDWGLGHDFKNFGTLLRSGIYGVKEGAGIDPAPWIMIHIDRGGDWGGTKWFFDGIEAENVPFDLIGESYYPQFHGPISGLKETLFNAAARYGKPIVVVETAYQFEPNQKPPAAGMTYPETPEGQLSYLRDLKTLVQSVPGGLGRGIVYWEPAWLPTKQRGGAWDTTALFDDNGNALPSLDIFAKSTRVTQVR